MCGLDEPPDNSAMDGFLRGLSTVCAPLDASLWPGNRVVRNQPGILVEKLDGALWAVVDIASSQPLGWFASPEDVLRVDDLLPGRLWWLAPGAADSDFPEARGAPRHCARSRSEYNRVSRAGSAPAIRALPTSRCCDGAPLSSGASSTTARDLLAVTHSEFIELRPLVLPARGQTRRGGILDRARGVQRAR